MTEFLQTVNWIDLLVVILLVRSGYVGFTKGLSWELFRLVGCVAAALISVYYYENVAQLASDYVSALYPFSKLISFTGLYLIIFLIFKFINALIAKLVLIEIFSTLEHLGGFLLGLVRGSIILSLLLISLLYVPIPYFEKSVRERSYIGPGVVKIVPFMYEKASNIFPLLKVGLRNEELIRMAGLEAPAPAPGTATKKKESSIEYKKRILKGDLQ